MSKKLIIILNWTIILLLGTFYVYGQKKETDLETKQITIKMESQPLGLVFRYLMENYDIPIGFEESTLDRKHSEYFFDTNLPGIAEKTTESGDGKTKIIIEVEREFEAKQHPITVNIENGNLQDVFNRIVRQMENYKWEVNDGVVNIYPIKGRDERFEKLLGTDIKKFSFEKGKTIKDITTKINALPELYRFLKENKLNFTGIRSGADFYLEAQYCRVLDIEMNFSNLTFRELLNKTTKIKRGGWILKWKGVSKTTGEEHIDIDI